MVKWVVVWQFDGRAAYRWDYRRRQSARAAIAVGRDDPGFRVATLVRIEHGVYRDIETVRA